jgi:hypothetical protein
VFPINEITHLTLGGDQPDILYLLFQLKNILPSRLTDQLVLPQLLRLAKLPLIERHMQPALMEQLDDS